MKSMSNWKELIISQNGNISGSQGKLDLTVSLERSSIDDPGYLGHGLISEITYCQKGHFQFDRNRKPQVS